MSAVPSDMIAEVLAFIDKKATESGHSVDGFVSAVVSKHQENTGANLQTTPAFAALKPPRLPSTSSASGGARHVKKAFVLGSCSPRPAKQGVRSPMWSIQKTIAPSLVSNFCVK